MTVTVGILLLLEAKPEKAEELAAFVKQGGDLARAEPLTVNWYGFRIDAVNFGVFDTFEAQEGREAHLAGEIAQALSAAAPDLLARAPDMRMVDVLAVK